MSRLNEKPIETLTGGTAGVRVEVGVKAQSVPPPPGESPDDCLDFIASNGSIDRYGERIDPAGWRLGPYLRNPVFLNAHRYNDAAHCIGRALYTEVRVDSKGQGYLHQRVQFAVEVNPVAKIIHGLYKGHFLNAVSVGFIPLTWKDEDSELGPVRVYTSQELVEVSAVVVPANREALLVGLRAGAIQRGSIRDALAMLASLMAEDEQREAAMAKHKALWDFARELRAAMQ